MNLFTVYILTCADGSYYVGMTSDIDRRLAEHNEGFYPNAYTFRRRPVILSFHYDCINIHEALAFEKQLKGWRREKKKALIEGRWDDLPELAMAYRDKTPLREPQGSFVNNHESKPEPQGSFGNNSESNPEPQGGFDDNDESGQASQGNFGNTDESFQEPQG